MEEVDSGNWDLNIRQTQGEQKTQSLKEITEAGVDFKLDQKSKVCPMKTTLWNGRESMYVKLNIEW